MIHKPVSNGKSTPSNQKAKEQVPNDENWKLLKFLCDRIEESNKKSKHASMIKKIDSPAAPIPITGNILAKRKKKKKKSKKNRISSLNKLSLTISPRSNRSNHSNNSIYSTFSTQSLDRMHTKTKSQALYTSAFKYNINSPTRTSKANTKYKYHHYDPHTSTYPVKQPTLHHTKSHSTELPMKYTHNSNTADSAVTTSSSDEADAFSPSNTVIRNDVSSSYVAETSDRDQDENANGAIIDIDANADVQSLVTLVRRVTQIYTKKHPETKVTDQQTIRLVYDKYVEFYRRPPVYPDHLRKFANKFQGIHVTYAAAKTYLDSVAAIAMATSPKIKGNQPKLDRFRLARSSTSSPLLINDLKQAVDSTDTQNTDANNPQSTHIKITHHHSADQRNKSKSKPEHQHEEKDNDRENLYAFYNLTDLELLQSIKRKMNAALRDGDDSESAIHMIWEREYSELEKRLHRAYTKPNNHIHPRGMMRLRQGSLSLKELKRDTTYKSLKQMSQATDIDDTDHDAAVYLLKTYFPDDEEEEPDYNHIMQDFDDSFSDMHISPNAAGTVSHRIHKSNIENSPHSHSLTVKPQQQHIRSITADKERKPALYRRSTVNTRRATTEALSLYDTMVMKARQSKIKQGKHSTRMNNNIMARLGVDDAVLTLRAQKSAPALQSIPSQDYDEEVVAVPVGDNVVQEYDIWPKNIGWKQQYHQPYRLEDDGIHIEHELSAEPPLFDVAFRQLTTSLYGTTSEEDDGFVDVNMNTDPEHSSNDSVNSGIPRNLLHIMSKYGHKMDRWDFDVFEFMDDPALCGKGLVCASFFLFRKIGLLDATGISQANLWRFLENVNDGYHANPYHNTYHAVDVLLSTHFMFECAFFKKHMTIWDQFGAYIAAVCHDLGHMGYNNAYYINTAGNLALLYGDDSVLENYHIAETFRILNDGKHNWMLSFPSSVRRYLATVIRRSILATDLKVHGTKMVQLQNMVDIFKDTIKNMHGAGGQSQHELFANNIQLWRCESIANYASLDNIMLDDFPLFMDDKLNKEWTRDIVIRDSHFDDDSNEFEDGFVEAGYDEEVAKKPRILGVDDERIFLLEITLHACDVANPCKPIHLAKEWANRYLREAFNQGDQERNIGIPVSAGMDRYTSKLATSQIGFITFIVKRLFQLYSEIIDVSQNCVDIMLQNEQYWIREKKKMNEKKINKPLSHLVTINE